MSEQTILTVTGAAMIAAALVIFIHPRGRPAPVLPPVPNADTPKVRLLVERDGGALRLRWNPDAPEIRNASHAVFYVNDGGRESRLNLDGPELRAGVASYWPQGQDVTFRLELAGGVSGEIRVSRERRPSPFEKEPGPIPLAKAAPLPPPQAADDGIAAEEPRATYTRYWTPSATPAAPPVRADEEKRVPTPPPAATGSADRTPPPLRAQAARHELPAAVPEAPAVASPKRSRLGRVVHKIPLLRRLHKER